MILLSFDIEEFDMPFEYKGDITFEEQISVSQNGLIHILDLLKKHGVKATFFSTVVFAENSKPIITRLINEGHELASHTWFHSKFSIDDLKKSKLELERLFNVEVSGLRMPRMMSIPAEDVYKAGYKYNSSVNPTYLPGRYNNLGISRTYYNEQNVCQIPASVSPIFRIPLFWLSFHNFPFWFYKKLASDTLNKDKYLNIYFHPWEFSNINLPEYKLSKITTRNTGDKMISRFDEFLSWLKSKNVEFGTFTDFLNKKKI